MMLFALLSATIAPQVGGLFLGDCVFVVVPTACTAGSLDASFLTPHTPLRLVFWEDFAGHPVSEQGYKQPFDGASYAYLVDLENLTWTKCDTNGSGSSALAEAPDLACPEDKVYHRGRVMQAGLALTMSCLLVMVYMVRDHNLGMGATLPYLTLVVYWLGDLMAGLFAGIVVSQCYATHSFGSNLVTTFLAETCWYDLPLTAVKMRCPNSFIEVAIVLGFILGLTAIDQAYTPSTIAFVGHHPLVLGALSFLLDFPKEVLKSFVTGRNTNDGYVPFVSELAHPLPTESLPTESAADANVQSASYTEAESRRRQWDEVFGAP